MLHEPSARHEKLVHECMPKIKTVGLGCLQRSAYADFIANRTYSIVETEVVAKQEQLQDDVVI